MTPTPTWIRTTEPVYAVYYSDRHKLELCRKYTVIGVGPKYITVRDFYDPTATTRRFHRATLRSVKVLPEQEELIPGGPRLNRARAATGLLSRFIEADRRMRQARMKMSDRNALRLLRDAVIAAEIAAESYAKVCVHDLP